MRPSSGGRIKLIWGIDMKTQMRFQKILMIVTIVVGALGAVYGLIFTSGSFAQINWIVEELKEVKDCFNIIQSANDIIFGAGIALVVVSVVPVIAACQSRRKYYITNYVAIGLVLAMQLIYIIIVIINIANCMSAFNSLDFELVKETYDFYPAFRSQYGELSATPWTPIAGFVLIGVIVINMVLLVLNTVWKVKLMKGEKQLLEQCKSVESGDSAAEVV